jgi:hypothetical protein
MIAIRLSLWCSRSTNDMSFGERLAGSQVIPPPSTAGSPGAPVRAAIQSVFNWAAWAADRSPG